MRSNSGSRIKHTHDGPCLSTECPGHHAFDDGDRADVRVADWLRSGSWPEAMPHAFRTVGTSEVMCWIADAIDAGEHHA